MKTGYLLFLAVLALVVTGCQTTGPYSTPGLVSPENRNPVTQPQQTAAWKGNDLTVEYRYNRNQSQMDISGRIDFADHIANSYTNLHDFRLSVIFLDENGKVLGTQGIVTNRGDFSPIPFQAKLTLPGPAVSISFSYQGTAIEGGDSGGGGGANYFWQYPIR